ncbi:hypothetical protein H4218_001936 [Coemansia sp. IMI 209128]|nr:hypothetical protein GGI06_001685 [Coemansia sp. S85]KAJ2417101.1 hypothetical protein GGI10_000438 [Coemansia sp. RSA 2530]KAJ2700622.1 hypothetical protein H4218_001936 [Coemansia sp. IMI 209128]
MKLALIALVSCLALSVKSVSYMGGISTPETHATQWTDSANLPTFANKNVPVYDVQSTDLICRSPDMTFAAKPFAIEAGKNIRVTWASDPKAWPLVDVLPKGPCTFWLAPVSSKGIGKVWSKIYEYTNNGKDGDETKWCSDAITTKGYYDVLIPSEIAKGTYILRSEIIDIVDASVSNYDDYSMGPRFYPNCLLLDITGTETAPLKSPVSILDVYKPYYKKPLLPKTVKSSQFKLPSPAPYAPAKP